MRNHRESILLTKSSVDELNDSSRSLLPNHSPGNGETCDLVFSPCSVQLKEIQVHRHVKDIVFITQQMEWCEEVQSEGMMLQTRL
jgi:hypothetical protein